MGNRNAGHMAMNVQNRRGKKHSVNNLIEVRNVLKTTHLVEQIDCLKLVAQLPDESVQLIICDPPYNILLADDYENYVSWASLWLKEAERVLKKQEVLQYSEGCNIRGKPVVVIL